MYEICVQQMYAAILEAQRGPRPERAGNSDPHVFHQGVYPVAGVDRWIAICCASVEDWRRLQTQANLPEFDAATCDARLGEWTQNQPGAALAERLQSAGIAAGMVQDIEELMQHDPQLAARGSLIPLQHPLLGPFGHVRTPLSLSRSAVAPYRAPSIGEHSREIAADLAGLAAERIGELEQLGVFQ
jgi:crotonobetainyl-CoA:carnitine CoA-transferase CaiB-like acyl-CoA transferase